MQANDLQFFKTQLTKIVNRTPIELRSNFDQSLNTISKLNISSFDMLLKALQNSQLDENTLLDMCWIAGQSGNKKFVKPLLNIFKEKSINLAWQAAQALRLLKSKRAIVSLIKNLKQNETFEKRQAAAYALGALPHTKAVQALIETLIDKNENVQVRGQAAESLALIGNGQPQVIATLLSALQDEEVEVRFWSLYTLGELGSREIIPALESLIADETILPGWWSISKEAHSAIEQIKSRNLIQ